MADFKLTDSVDEILQKMNKTDGNTEAIHAGPCFLEHKLQEKLLSEQDGRHKQLMDSQNVYNEKQLLWTRSLAIATWALVVATALLIKYN